MVLAQSGWRRWWRRVGGEFQGDNKQLRLTDGRRRGDGALMDRRMDGRMENNGGGGSFDLSSVRKRGRRAARKSGKEE